MATETIVATGLESDTDSIAQFAALADPYRLAVLRILAAGPVCVCEIQEQIDIAANLLSYHLKVLREAGLITGERRGRWVDYRLVEGVLDRLRDTIPAAPSGCSTGGCGCGS